MAPRRPFIPLHQKMQDSGYSLRSLADEINLHFDLHITKPDVSNFINSNHSRIARKKRRVIRLFFIAHGWISQPKKKPIPVCNSCGKKYPTGKPHSSFLTVPNIQRLIAVNNHKRATIF